MRMIARFEKRDVARHVAHLDLLRAMQRALRRAHLPVKYSEGFNPHQVIAFGSAMSVGMESEGEWLDVALDEEMEEEEFLTRAAAQMPPGIAMKEAHAVPDPYPALMRIIASAEYDVLLTLTGRLEQKDWQKALQRAQERPILAMKKSKKGPREVDLRELVLSIEDDPSLFCYTERGDTRAGLRLRLVHASTGALNPSLLLPALLESMEMTGGFRAVRKGLYAQKAGEACPVWAL